MDLSVQVDVVMDSDRCLVYLRLYFRQSVPRLHVSHVFKHVRRADAFRFFVLHAIGGDSSRHLVCHTSVADANGLLIGNVVWYVHVVVKSERHPQEEGSHHVQGVVVLNRVDGDSRIAHLIVDDPFIYRPGFRLTGHSKEKGHVRILRHLVVTITGVI